MSRQQRITFAAIAVVIAVVAVIVLAGGSDEETERADRPPTGTPTATATQTTPEETATAEPTPEPTPEPIEIEVEGGEVAGGAVDIDVQEGERVRFTVTSDTADHVHVHGYDVLRDVGPGQTARFNFKADITGVFEVELEGAGKQIARLRVQQ